jgi:hypothetical protein
MAAKTPKPAASPPPSAPEAGVLRLPAEQAYATELAALIAHDREPRPTGWRLSPRAVLTYILGGQVGGQVITPKYVGERRLVEVAIATLLTDRALLLLGEPGTAKSWLSEHLAAAIHGDSTKVVQGTAGTTEEAIRYSWNYALLPKDPANAPWSPARCTAPWKKVAWCAWKRLPAARPKSRTP